jgi:hypothetical protein
MKKDTTPKKAWQKPEVTDLDVNRETSKYAMVNEVGIYGPAAS